MNKSALGWCAAIVALAAIAAYTPPEPPRELANPPDQAKPPERLKLSQILLDNAQRGPPEQAKALERRRLSDILFDDAKRYPNSLATPSPDTPAPIPTYSRDVAPSYSRDVEPMYPRDTYELDKAIEALEARRTFGGYACTYDCSGHTAGYEWAEENGIDDESDCGGNSQSFIEGCEEYANEQSSSYDYGYEWAEDNDIDDVSDCAGDGDAHDGCAEYVEEQADE